MAKLRALGGKFGERVCLELGVQTVGELAAVAQPTLQQVRGSIWKGMWVLCVCLYLCVVLVCVGGCVGGISV